MEHVREKVSQPCPGRALVDGEAALGSRCLGLESQQILASESSTSKDVVTLLAARFRSSYRVYAGFRGRGMEQTTISVKMITNMTFFFSN